MHALFEKNVRFEKHVSIDSGSGRLPEVSVDPALEGLHPSLGLLPVLFTQLSKIPRPSGKEGLVRQWLEGIADRNDWSHKCDAAGNLVIKVPAKGAVVGAKTVGIQAHTDMVVNPKDHDFEKQPMQLERRRQEVVIHNQKKVVDVLGAVGTTLGADNGIGLCAGLAVALDENAIHPELELICTVDEERALTGAGKLDPVLISARLMLNLDTEEIGEMCVGCAGGRRMQCAWSDERITNTEGRLPVEIKLDGLPSGHSGTSIHERRGNACKMLVYCLNRCRDSIDATSSLELAEISGGTASNVIPSDARAVVWIDKGQNIEHIQRFLDAMLDRALGMLAPQYRADVKICVAALEPATAPLPLVFGEQILQAIDELKDGVISYSKNMQGFVETSTSLGTITTEDGKVTIVCAGRSADNAALKHLQDAMQVALEKFGGSVFYSKESYPGWQPNPTSPLVARAIRSYRETFGEGPKVGAVHAGLECGVIGGKIPGLDMVSFGPTILDAHSIRECLVLETLKPFMDQLRALLKDLAFHPLEN